MNVINNAFNLHNITLNISHSWLLVTNRTPILVFRRKIQCMTHPTTHTTTESELFLLWVMASNLKTSGKGPDYRLTLLECDNEWLWVSKTVVCLIYMFSIMCYVAFLALFTAGEQSVVTQTVRAAQFSQILSKITILPSAISKCQQLQFFDRDQMWPDVIINVMYSSAAEM